MLRNLKEFSLPAVEEKVLAYWRANRVFEATLKATAKGKEFVFYEGPPTANGRPGIHHVLARAFKDIVLRYKTMRGFHVPRKGGWDTHGLPVEIGVEKALGLKSKKEIEAYGVAAFNRKCRESVWEFKEEWERLTERMGFWLDLKHPYITYENRYIESVWAIFGEIWKKKLLYQGHKVVPWCPRCGTGLSSHELALGYDTVEDTSVYVKFYAPKLKAHILSWTTTPWTLPGNVALAVNEKVTYVKVKMGKEFLILAKPRLSAIAEPYEIVEEMPGKKLVGVSYEPLFDVPTLKSKTSYKVYPADFVTTEDGTGVVHTAVMYGEDDYRLGMKVGLPARHTVDEAGKFTKDVKGFSGLFVKAPETEKKILAYLEKNGTLLKTEKYSHEYPFCWRCQTPLLYYARDSWFIAMSKLRAKLIAENEKINWVPAHLKEGRFGEWLREVKDWAISRSRYWGTPLPIWECGECGAHEVIGGMAALQERAGTRNTFVFVRHGESDHNVLGLCGPYRDTKAFTSHLTKKGATAIRRTAASLKNLKVDHIITSPLARAKETGKVLQEVLGGKLSAEAGFREMDGGKIAGKPIEDWRALFKEERDAFEMSPHQGETWRDVQKRMKRAFDAVNARYRGKTIVVVSHGDPLWILKGVLEGASEEEQLTIEYPKTGARYDIRTGALPRDAEGKVDLHKPYLDAVTFPCAKCKGTMKRIPDVADVWFDSGAMPFAQAHYPFEEKHIAYPADYISEAIDQTRGWFYTLHAIGVLMEKGRAYKNVISLGLVLDKNGQKMSKSKGNIVDPWAMIGKYGVDAVRWYFYTVNPPGEPKRFDEAELGKTLRQFIMLVYNSWLFYDTYADRSAKRPAKPGNILDEWVLTRLTETESVATKSLEKYEVGEAARAIEAFAGDLSRWYIRRSRRRLQKPDDKKDYEAASATLGYALLELAKLVAPFAPFFAEALYLSLVPQEKGRIESVHLEDWPETGKKPAAGGAKLLKEMEEIRALSSAALAERSAKGIKVRQPLAKMGVKGKYPVELLKILADEVNVKEVKTDPKLKTEFALDTVITHELLEEGWFREMVRTVQGMRQDAKLMPKDAIAVFAELSGELAHVVRARETEFKREVNAKAVEFGRAKKFNVEFTTKIGDESAWFAVKKL